MSNARNLADIITGNFDVPLGALDNVPPSNDASALTTGTLPVGRLPSSGVDASSLTTGTLPIARIADGDVSLAKFGSGVLASGVGYVNNANGSVGVTFPNNANSQKILQTDFTIPSVTGITNYIVIANCSWTGAAGGHRVWTYVTLDHDNTGANGAPNNNNNPDNNNGWAEHGWAESDISSGAFAYMQGCTWTNVPAGSHSVRIFGYSNNSSSTCWRAGMSIIWIPRS